MNNLSKGVILGVVTSVFVAVFFLLVGAPLLSVSGVELLGSEKLEKSSNLDWVNEVLFSKKLPEIKRGIYIYKNPLRDILLGSLDLKIAYILNNKISFNFVPTDEEMRLVILESISAREGHSKCSDSIIRRKYNKNKPRERHTYKTFLGDLILTAKISFIWPSSSEIISPEEDNFDVLNYRSIKKILHNIKTNPDMVIEKSFHGREVCLGNEVVATIAFSTKK